MANITAANGTISFNTNAPLEIYHLFLAEFSKHLNQGYNTTFSNYEGQEPTPKTFHIEQPNQLLDFFGTGRWSFDNNIDWTFRVLFDDNFNADLKLNWSPDQWDVINKLKQYNWTAEYDYTDDGDDFITVAERTVSWDPVDQKQTTVLENIQFSGDRSPNNMTLWLGYEPFQDSFDDEHILTYKSKFETFLNEQANAGELEYDIVKNILKQKDAFYTWLEKNTEEGPWYDYEINTWFEDHDIDKNTVF